MFKKFEQDNPVFRNSLIADSALISKAIADHHHFRWHLQGEKFGLPQAFGNLLTKSQREILYREKRFGRR